MIELYPPVRRDLPVDAWSEERKEAVLARAVEALGRVHPLDIAVKRLVSPKDFRDNLNWLIELSPVSRVHRIYSKFVSKSDTHLLLLCGSIVLLLVHE